MRQTSTIHPSCRRSPRSGHGLGSRRHPFGGPLALFGVVAALAGFTGVAPGQTGPAAAPPAAPAAPAGRPAAPATPPATPGQPGGRPATPAKRPGGTPVSERVEGLRPRAVPPKANFTGGPAIWFDVLDYDFGPMTNAETRDTKFTFTNVGDAPLTVADVVPACGCTRPTFDKGKTYQPGESGVISVAFTPPTGGHQAKSISVMTNAKNPGDLVKIRVIGEVETVLSFEPRSFDAGEIRSGKAWEGTVELKADAPETIFESVTLMSRSEGLTIGFVEPGPHKGKATIKMNIAPTVPWGLYRTGIAEIVVKGKLENGQEIVKKLPFRVLAKVVDEVRATDFVVQCGTHNYNEAFKGEVIVFGDEPFEVVNPVVEPLPRGSKGVANATYTVKVEPSDDPEKKGWKIILSGQSEQSHGFLAGSLKFGTKLRGSDKVVPRQLGINGYIVEPGGKPPMQMPTR